MRSRWAAGAASFVLIVLAGTLVGAESADPATLEADTVSVTGTEETHGPGPDYAAPMSIEEIRSTLNKYDEKSRFDGIVQGWRLAPSEVLEAEGIADANLKVSCTAREAGQETPTPLDFTLGYFPETLVVEHVAEPQKVVCGDDAYSVFVVYTLNTPMGSGDLFVSRRIWGRRALDLSAAADSVHEATLNGKPAILVMPPNPEFGLGVGQVIVIEDDDGPEFTVLRVYNDNGVPFDELVKIVEGLK